MTNSPFALFFLQATNKISL